MKEKLQLTPQKYKDLENTINNYAQQIRQPRRI